MKSVFYKILFLIAFSLGVSFITGCQEEPAVNKVEEEFNGVTIRIPLNTKFVNSRADGDGTAPVVGQEGDIKNIYLFVISSVNNEKSFEILKLTEPLKSTDGSNTYLDYKTPLETGNYKFHLVANFDDYLFGSVPQIISSEDQLINLVNTFTTDKELVPGNLPMYCLYASVNGSTSQNEIYVEKGKPVTVMCPLTFLCSKIRYTILFDAREGGFSSGFGDKRIRFLINDENKPYAKNFGSENEYDGFSDYTYKLTNPNFDNNNSEGWEGPAFGFEDPFHNGNTYGVAEHFNKTFTSYQTLQNMPAGIYNFEVQGFYRNGSMATAWLRYLYGTQQYLAKIYIEDTNNNTITESPFRSLYSEYFGNLPGLYPDNLSQANDAFQSGYYKGNGVTYTLTSSGTLQLGIRKTKSEVNDWTCFDNFQLFYKPLSNNKDNSNLKQTIPLDKFTFTWDPKPNPSYPTSANDELDRFIGSDDEWIDLGYKAWQGLIYLPENNESDINKRTVLHFPYSFGDESERPRGEKTLILFGENDDSNPVHDRDKNQVTHGLERGMMYDIVIKVVKDIQVNDEFTLNVRVMDWKYNPEETIW